MVFELNEVVVDGMADALTMQLSDGQTACIACRTEDASSRLLHALMGFREIRSGYVCIDGEPLSERSLSWFREMIAFAPQKMESVGRLFPVDAPSPQDVFALRKNRHLPISNGLLAETARSLSPSREDSPQLRLIAVALLLKRPVTLIQQPPLDSLQLISDLARREKRIILATSILSSPPAYVP